MPIRMEQKSQSDIVTEQSDVTHEKTTIDQKINKQLSQYDNDNDNDNNSNYLVWIFIIFGLLILGGAAYWYYQK